MVHVQGHTFGPIMQSQFAFVTADALPAVGSIGADSNTAPAGWGSPIRRARIISARARLAPAECPETTILLAEIPDAISPA